MARVDRSVATEETVAAAQGRLARSFAAAGLDSPALDARRLVSAATGESVEALVMGPQRLLGPRERARLDGFAQRRLAHEPVSRILGQRGFHGLTFEVTADTLDPRPDSETAVDLALSLLREEGREGDTLRILDLCTGTGCLLLSLLSALPRATGLGTDISPAALDVARRNAARLGLAARCGWQVADGLNGVTGPFDLAIANPPYVRSQDIAELAPEVSRYDPRLALDGGPDGLALYRRIVAGCTQVVPSGWIVVEVGAGQAEPVTHMIQQQLGSRLAGPPRQAADLGGHIRCVAWRTR